MQIVRIVVWMLSFKNFIKLTNYGDSHEVHTCVWIKTDFKATFNCSCWSLSKSSYWVASLKSRRLVSQIMNTSNRTFTVYIKPHSTWTFFLLAFFEDVTLTPAHYITYNYNLQKSNYIIEKHIFYEVNIPLARLTSQKLRSINKVVNSRLIHLSKFMAYFTSLNIYLYNLIN